MIHRDHANRPLHRAPRRPGPIAPVISGIGRRIVPFAILVLLAALTYSPLAWGQTYSECKQLPLPSELKDKGSIGKLRQEKNNAIKEGIAASGAKAAIDAFYFRYLFPAMTREDHAGSVAELRIELFKDIERADPVTRRYLISLAYKGSTVILNDPRFHPAAQVNAVLILGELNLQEGSGNEKAPLPAAPLTKKLVELVTSDKHTDPVRVTALVALERHARLRGAIQGAGALKEDERALIRKVALDILNQVEPPPERTPEAQDWVRMQAVRILKAVEDSSSSGDVAKALEAITADPKQNIDLRCSAMEALGAVNPKTWQPDPAKFVFHSARLLVDVLSAELDKIREDLNPSGGRRGPGERIEQGPFEMQGEDDTKNNVLVDPRTKDYRRQVLQRLTMLDRGLNGDTRSGIAGVASVIGPGPLESVLAGLKKASDAAHEISSTLEELGYKLDEVRNSLDEQYPDPNQRPRWGRWGRDR